MTRAADYTIQGFLYQFHKTVLEILRSSEDSEITVEGIIEDIDVVDASGIKAIQCKYHEIQQDFALSLVYKPILQMLHHFHSNQDKKVRYVLYAHFPNETAGDIRQLSKTEMTSILQSNNKDLKQYTAALRNNIDVDKFIPRFSLEFGHSWDTITKAVREIIKENGVPEADIDTLAYPNAIQEIANLSIRHDEQSRRITKSELIRKLQKIRKTAISRWTLALRSRKQLLDARRKLLKPNLDKNVRKRYFYIHQTSIEDFDSEIILFVRDYLERYHFKTAHTETPLFCLDCEQADFEDVQHRLYQKGIVAADGLVGSHFHEERFFRDPMVRKVKGGHGQREFSIRLLRFASHGQVINKCKSDDLFIIGDGRHDVFEVKDVNVELLEARDLKEIKYLLGVSNAFA